MYMKRSGRENYSVPLVTLDLTKEKKKKRRVSPHRNPLQLQFSFRAGEPILGDSVLSQPGAAPWLFTDGPLEIFFCTVYYFKAFFSTFFRSSCVSAIGLNSLCGQTEPETGRSCHRPARRGAGGNRGENPPRWRQRCLGNRSL